jgi:hypothetical protein
MFLVVPERHRRGDCLQAIGCVDEPWKLTIVVLVGSDTPLANRAIDGSSPSFSLGLTLPSRILRSGTSSAAINSQSLLKFPEARTRLLRRSLADYSKIAVFDTIVLAHCKRQIDRDDLE